MKLKPVFRVLGWAAMGVGVLLLVAWLMNVASLISWGSPPIQAVIGIACIALGAVLRRRGR